METYNIHEAKTHLSRLVDEAVDGKPFVIAKRGKQLVKVIPLASPEHQPKRLIGFMKGTFTLPDNFDEIDKKLDKEVERLFLGENDE
jgi:prevent-host-death family protein